MNECISEITGLSVDDTQSVPEHQMEPTIRISISGNRELNSFLGIPIFAI